MPIYEFACPKCKVIFSFLSKRVNPERTPRCPKCSNPNLVKQISRFTAIRGVPEPKAKDADVGGENPGPDMDDPRVMRAMAELERDLEYMDENNPRHMAHMMKKMKEILPPGTLPKEMDVAIRRLEKGEDPEKIEEDMGDVLGEAFGGPEEEDDYGWSGGYTRDSGLYEY